MDSESRTKDSVLVGMEDGGLKGTTTTTTKEVVRQGRTAHSVSSSSLRRKSELQLISKVQCGVLKNILNNLQQVILGTKLALLFPAIPLAIAAHQYNFGRVSPNYKQLFSLLFIVINFT